MVLARFDRADIDEIRPPERRVAVNRGRRKIDAEWRDEHGRGTPGAIEMGLQSGARYRRIDNQRVGKLSRGLNPGEMVCRLPGLGVFGKFNRNEVMVRLRFSRWWCETNR